MMDMKLQIFAEPALPKNTESPEMNFETEAFINTSPAKAGEPTWKSLAALTKNMSQSLNEVLYQASYYEGKGWGSTEVTGGQMTLTLTGDVMPEDEACSWLMSEDVMYKFGNARKTHLKIQKGTKIIIWPVTLANITPAYGDAGTVNSLTVTIHGNGQPVIGTTE